MPERDRDEFDDIVDRLELDLTFPEDPPERREPPPAPPPPPSLPPELADLDDQPDPVDEQFYRRVPTGPARPIRRGHALAWAGVVGTPVLLVLATLAGQYVTRPVLLAAGVTFVAGAIYLISQLPEHGPSQRDWPDDGAEL